MTNTRHAFIKANWHADIVDQALAGFLQILPSDNVEVYDVPGAFELPLLAKQLARSGRFASVTAAALIVDGGIYRHDFVAKTVVNALMQVGLETEVPILSVALTPHHFQETDHHRAIFRDHFVQKGKEAGQAALRIGELHQSIAA